MPRRSYRQRELRRREKQLAESQKLLMVELVMGGSDGNDSDDDSCSYDGDVEYDGVTDAGDSDSESDGEGGGIDDALIACTTALEEYDYAVEHRYLAPRVSRKSGLNIFEEDLDPDADYRSNDRQFRNKYRVSRNSVYSIAGEIKDDPIFKNLRGPKQAPVEHQLMTLLNYMGHEGSTNDSQRNTFRIGTGTCEDYRRRAKDAILSLKKNYVYWPDAEEREELGKRFGKKYHCPHAISVGDGTLTELAFAPQCHDAADYHGRKLQWSLTTLIIGDDNGLIRYYLTGFPGSAHDNRVWSWSKVCQNPTEHFSQLEYLLLDTAFEASPVSVPAYKADSGLPYPSDPKKEKFNKVIGKPRVISERMIGMLKGRFPAVMRKNRKLITEDVESLKEILEYMDCAFILHNILVSRKDCDIFDNDDWDEWHDECDDLTDVDDPSRVDPDSLTPEELAMNSPLPLDAPKDLRRTLLADLIWEKAVDDNDSETSDSESDSRSENLLSFMDIEMSDVASQVTNPPSEMIPYGEVDV